MTVSEIGFDPEEKFGKYADFEVTDHVVEDGVEYTSFVVTLPDGVTLTVDVTEEPNEVLIDGVKVNRS